MRSFGLLVDIVARDIPRIILYIFTSNTPIRVALGFFLSLGPATSRLCIFKELKLKFVVVSITRRF